MWPCELPWAHCFANLSRPSCLGDGFGWRGASCQKCGPGSSTSMLERPGGQRDSEDDPDRNDPSRHRDRKIIGLGVVTSIATAHKLPLTAAANRNSHEGSRTPGSRRAARLHLDGRTGAGGTARHRPSGPRHRAVGLAGRAAGAVCAHGFCFDRSLLVTRELRP